MFNAVMKHATSNVSGNVRHLLEMTSLCYFSEEIEKSPKRKKNMRGVFSRYWRKVRPGRII